MKLLEAYKELSDPRGAFLGIVNSGHWEEINFIETDAGQIRGGHYHKETRELFFIIEGEIDIKIEDMNGKVLETISVSKGSIFVIEPYEVHTFHCKSKSKWINVLSKRIDDQFHDIHIPLKSQSNQR